MNNYDIVDKDRVGVIGWSHGGLIALMDTTTMNTEKSSQQNFISAKPHTITVLIN
ncbi:MAG: hypothetical protein KKF20_03380 [Bacteroidetes bacterium]|nr:hypothetical protein [Bacteroidota bacterium]MBU1423533.1 hypothetical protein [Bacteroidota bacterium]MBU2471431.1 hypothetical protein [Bacteroidota bacterium]MBU2635612.1 hypothetical protein [Bacteroidota bacterium]